jgi:hypothetical protein
VLVVSLNEIVIEPGVGDAVAVGDVLSVGV